MSRSLDDIQDDEIRIIGHPIFDPHGGHKRKSRLSLILAIVLGVAVIVTLVVIIRPRNEEVPDVFDPSSSSAAAQTKESSLPKTLGNYSDTVNAYTEKLTLTINDIPLDIYIPHNATPVLSIGKIDHNDENIIFATQAADIRADNGKINGAYVLAGEPKAWGLSKKGYVGIIDGKISVGVADNSPLFEEATECGGYFFRQYPLVNNGVLVENEPKNKAVRKSICERGGEIIIVMSQTKESFHDFTQALVDFGVDNAVYLVGAESIGFYRDYDGNLVHVLERQGQGYRFENYILWIKKTHLTK